MKATSQDSCTSVKAASQDSCTSVKAASQDSCTSVKAKSVKTRSCNPRDTCIKHLGEVYKLQAAGNPCAGGVPNTCVKVYDWTVDAVIPQHVPKELRALTVTPSGR